MEKFNPGKKDESISNKVSNFVKSTLVSKLLDASTLNKDLADNLYANRILEEERIAPNKFYSGFTPSLPEGAKVINIGGSDFVQINGRMYYVRKFKKGFDLVDNTYDFMPRPDELYPSKTKLKYQKKYDVSDAGTPINTNQLYTFDETKDDIDDWIIHNDMGQIKKNRSGKDETWWLKGEPYKGMEKRSLIKDKPEGRHLFAKQSALETSIGKPLDQHRELIGDVIKEGDIEDGGITITPTSEEDLPNIEGLQSLTYNPVTKSMERGIFHNSNKSKGNNDKK